VFEMMAIFDVAKNGLRIAMEFFCEGKCLVHSADFILLAAYIQSPERNAYLSLGQGVLQIGLPNVISFLTMED
jgi:hypothetical protein